MAGKKKRVVKKRFPAKAKLSANLQGKISSKFKFGVVFRNLILFVLLSLISYILYLVSENDVFVDIFNFLWIIFGFIAIAFLLALLVLFFLKLVRR